MSPHSDNQNPYKTWFGDQTEFLEMNMTRKHIRIQFLLNWWHQKTKNFRWHDRFLFSFFMLLPCAVLLALKPTHFPNFQFWFSVKFQFNTRNTRNMTQVSHFIFDLIRMSTEFQWISFNIVNFAFENLHNENLPLQLTHL